MIMTLRAGSYLEFVLEMIMFSVKTSVFVEAQIYKSDPIFIFPVLFLKFDFLNMKLLFFFFKLLKENSDSKGFWFDTMLLNSSRGSV